MKYPKEYLDEIKLRLKVSRVVGKYVKLKKRGKEFIGLSPFSNEKTPSFTINDEKGFYHCFSSSEHGNIFDFLMKTKNLKFGESVRMLAAEAGMVPYKFTQQDDARQNRWKIYNNILEAYSNFFHQELISNKNQEVLKYLDNRKITKKEINYFQIGYVVENNNFYEKLIKEFDEKEIISSGIYYFDENRKKYVDRFRDRIIFPIKSLNNLVFALGGRAFSKKALAKYVNSPETEFYKKGNNLYNINNAKGFRNENNEVFIVEGYLDVISLHKFGISNVVANLGTAITEKQINLIWSFFKNAIICLDGDSSGQKAAIRIAERLFPLMKSDFNIFFLSLPEGLDPDVYINKKGKESFLELTKSKVEIQDFIWQSYYEKIDRNSPHSLSIFEKKMKTFCKEVNDKTLAKYYLDNFNQKFMRLTPTLRSNINNYKFKKIPSPYSETLQVYQQRNKFSEKVLKEFSIIYVVINNLDFFSKNIELVSNINFSDDLMNEFKNNLINLNIQEKTIYSKTLVDENLNLKFSQLLENVNLYAPIKTIIKNKSEYDVEMIFNDILYEINKIDLHGKIQTLENKIAKNMDENLYEELLSLKNQLKNA